MTRLLAGFGSFAIAACMSVAAGAGQPPDAAAAPQNQAEISTREERATFTSHVDLVMVPVVVRDKQGRVVDGLTRDFFRLFDKGKLQEIERFAVERPGAIVSNPSPESVPGEAAPTAPDRVAVDKMPRRFIGYLFDDVHMEFADLVRARQAAERHLDTELTPTDRAAIFTTSGQGTVDFTDDLGKLRQGLLRLIPRPIAPSTAEDGLTFYQADMIVNHDDPVALQAAQAGSIAIMPTGRGAEAALAQLRAAAQRVLSAGEYETQTSLSVLREAVRRMSAAPGDRVLVLVSPGFYTLAENQPEENDVIERALRANVVINALNPMGLYVPKAGFDASQRSIAAAGVESRSMIERQTHMADEAILMEFTADTGGDYFHNNNDLAAGFRRTAAAPELYYLLGFQPQNLKLDGNFHGLKVAIESKAGYSIEARRGYYAPTHLEDAAATAKREIEDAVYSREEMSDLPVQLHTQFFKGAGDAATVTLLAHVDLAGARFRKEDGRSLDNITVVSALFDHNGNVVTGMVKHVDLRLRDDSLQYRLAHGVAVRMGLEVKPGSYVVRVVVRETEGQLMSAVNGTVEVP